MFVAALAGFCLAVSISGMWTAAPAEQVAPPTAEQVNHQAPEQVPEQVPPVGEQMPPVGAVG